MKRYPLGQSRLYNVTSPADLATRLGMDLEVLEHLANHGDNYKRFNVGKAKKRAVQEPKDRLKQAHLKVSRWLSRIETPEYLHSAVRGRSYITNAKAHSAEVNLIKVDIKSFFQNVTTHSVYLFLLDTMKCRKDVAMLLAKLLTVDGHLPTGSSVSPILSFYAHKRMFDEIAALAQERNLRFTVYVDDMCLSGDEAVRATLFRVRGIIARHGLKSHKCRYFPAGVPRVVTGSALTIRGFRLPHRRHLKIKDAFENLDAMPEGPLRDKAIDALRSRLFEAAQLEPAWADRARSTLFKR
ncbi:reverse transcriptase family protein [Roseibium album]|uniref:reverse transcriptase family protein n=1 Tax=Roseibium album TaxID=311410 RepID=UPI002492AB18|nr:reverse transcriptase family protein [Roseibium album]